MFFLVDIVLIVILLLLFCSSGASQSGIFPRAPSAVKVHTDVHSALDHGEGTYENRERDPARV